MGFIEQLLSFFLYFEIFYQLGEKKVVRSKITKLESSGRELDLYD